MINIKFCNNIFDKEIREILRKVLISKNIFIHQKLKELNPEIYQKDLKVIQQFLNNDLEFLDFSNLTYILDKIRFYKEKKLKINVIIEQVQNDIESNFIEFLYKELINILGIAFDLNKIKIYKKENNLKIEAIEPILKFVELNID